MRRMALLVATVAGALLVGAAADAATVYSNDFSGNANGFTGGTLTSSPSGEQFLYLGGGGHSARLDLALPAHTGLTVNFDLYVVGSMDGYDYNGAGVPGGNGGYGGDYFAVISSTGGGIATLFNNAFANYGGSEEQSYPTANSAPGAGAYSTNGLGYTGFPVTTGGSQDAEYHVSIPIADTGSSSLGLTFVDHSNEGASNEFYGIDNLVVSAASPSGVPEPAAWASLMLGVFGVGGAMRVRRKQGEAVAAA